MHRAFKSKDEPLQTYETLHNMNQSWQEEGPAFTPLIRALATGLMIGMVYWGARSADEIFAASTSLAAKILIGFAFLVCCLVYYWILISRTTVTTDAITQTWIWNKHIQLKDIQRVKLIFIPYLAWLIAPRLVVRSGLGVMVFHTATPGVLAAFARISLGRAPDDVAGDYADENL